jgi:hypothetical protein
MITRSDRTTILTLACLAAVASGVKAQLVVYDPANYIEAVAQIEQLVAQFKFWVAQVKRLPGDLTRYRLDEVRWRNHDNAGLYTYARPIINGLNGVDISGAFYDSSVDRLEALDGSLPFVPADFQKRLQTDYGSIQLGDSVAKMAIDQIGRTRLNGRAALRTILGMEDDAVSGSDSFHTQTALLNKINGATVLALRVNETASQLQLHMLEQLLVQNKRTRDAEAQAMDAHLFQWRYGTAYGRDLFSRTASALDSWRQP